MVIDAAKGIEAQTRKLFEVCRLRDIPIMTFVNKMDREARDPFELLDEISDQLQLEMRADGLAGRHGAEFQGRATICIRDEFVPFGGDEPHRRQCAGHVLPADVKAKLDEDVELARAGLPRFDLGDLSRGPSVAGLFRLGAEEFRRARTAGARWRAYAPPPRAAGRRSAATCKPSDEEVTGFVFKVQANMDPNHRDRVAFLRLARAVSAAT